MRACNPNYKDAVWAFYRYEPSKSAAIAFAILFTLTTILHALQMWRSRIWFLSALVVGVVCEVIGYIGRLLSANEEPGCWTIGPFVIQNLFLLIAPAFMAASIYMTLGRIVELVEADRHSIIRRQWLTKIFVVGDVLSLLFQAAGSGMMASADMMHTGENIVVVGLFVQLAFFGFFIVVGGVFHYRMLQSPTTKSWDPKIRWQPYLITLYVVSVLILVRSVFRLIEYIDGNDGPLMSSEVYVYIFDGTLMLMALVWLNWFQVGEVGLLLRGGGPINNGLELMKLDSRERFRIKEDGAELGH